MADNFVYVSGPIAQGDRCWTFEGLLKGPLGIQMPVRMTVLGYNQEGSERLGLVLVSSFPPDIKLTAALNDLGDVEYLLIPNSAHSLWAFMMKEQAYPEAIIVAPPIIPKKKPEFKVDIVLETVADLPAGWPSTDVDVYPTKPGLATFQEIALVHRPSKSLIVTDLAFNMTANVKLGFLLRMFMHFQSGYRPCCVTKMFGSEKICTDAAAMCSILDKIVEESDFDRVIMAHGEVVQSGGKKAFQEGTVAFYHDVAAKRG